MLFQKSSWIIAASSLAIVLLIVFQFNWLQQSRRLIEEQFDQKVTMALCSAIEELSHKRNRPHQSSHSCLQKGCLFGCTKAEASCAPNILVTNSNNQEIELALSKALDRYDIDLGFSFDIIPQAPSRRKHGVYCSSMSPISQDDRKLKVQFHGKERYVMQKMGFMAGASLIIVLFVAILFATTLFKLVQLRRLHTLSVDFFNNMAHEFRTPLTNIRLALGRWQKKNLIDSSERYVNVIDTESQRLLHQVERILQVAKLEKGDFALDWEELDLIDLIEEVADEMRLPLQEKGGQLFISPSEEAYIIDGDRLHLSNVMRNLIENAIKYCDKAPYLDIAIQRVAEEVRVSFQDNGIGIKEGQQKHIFDTFSRGHSGDIHQQKGFGLGLSYVKNIVERHGGSVQLMDSSCHGSCFALYFPIKIINHATV